MIRNLAFLSLLLTGTATFVPTAARAIEPVRIVGTGGRIGYTFYTLPASNTAFRQRTPHKLGGPVSEIQIGFMDWMYTDKTETANATNDVTLDHVWLERASTGQVVPVTFDGNRSFVLPMNSTTPYWLADPIPSSVWTGSAPVQDEIFWLHVKGTVPEGGKVPVGTPATYSGAKFIAYDAAVDPGTSDTAGTVPAITGSTSRIEGLPLIFLGRFTGPGHLAVMGIGDSIMNGTGDNANPVPVVSGFGFFNRAAVDTNGENAIAMFNLTRHGQTAAAWVNPSKQQRQTPFLKFANVAVEEYGTNDLGTAGTGTPSSIVANLEGIWTAARNAGVQKIIRTLLMPRAESTYDQWRTPENQIPNTGWGTGEKRDQINAAFYTARDAGKIDTILDTLAVIGDPADNTRWLTNGNPKYTTSDGTHVSPAGNALLAPHLRAALLSLTVDEDRPDYPAWSDGIDWGANDPSPAGDANGDGVKNLLAYALNVSPLEPIPSDALPAATIDTTTAGGPWLEFSWRENADAVDLLVTVETSGNLTDWTKVKPDGITHIFETLPDSGVPGVVHRRLRVKQPSDGTKPAFLRLHVVH